MPTLADRLARTVSQHSRSEAVRCRGRSLDYAGLDRASSALAATMREAGIGPGDRVGLWTGTSAETVVAVHAVLKCGAAYVPLDPAAPAARVAHILRDCAVGCLVADTDRLALLADERVPEHAGPRLLVVLDGQDDGVPAPGTGTAQVSWREAVERPVPDGFAPVPVSGSDLAYVLYTSGSTGLPKGVMLSHRNALSFVDWAVGTFGITADDRLASHAPFHFDLSVFDLFAAASTGACLVLVPENHKGLGVALNRLVRDEAITVWYSVPEALVRMLDAKNNDELETSRLRTVLFAGEEFPLKHLRRLSAALPGAALYNLYGPTETNVCTFHRVSAEDLADGRTAPPPIGAPCPYADARLLDPRGLPVPDEPGAEGELCVAGDSVMLGYWDSSGRAALSAGVHRTGDIVRREEHGYRFVGRRDHMVKIRGYRIEPAEIEAVLLAMPEVHEAVCVPVRDGDQDRLRAVLVPAAGRLPTEGELRRHCLRRLPRYMVPGEFGLVDALPRTSTGKTDRSALAAPAFRGFAPVLREEETPCRRGW
ncbi:amino acid adenylation domain-containing protein [Streptomyces sp. NPDC088116]|uniref:amino acid adenylation domain-containing protein n=1 Tax=Streptomyces sp. NPDC088116 TaxID=3365825 RepID=UPI00381FC4F4